MSLQPPELELEVPSARASEEWVSAGRQTRPVLRAFASNRLAIIGCCVIVALVVFSFLGPLLHHTDQVNPSLETINHPPGGGHPLGTDANGFDVLGRLMLGGRATLLVGIVVGLVSTLLGLAYGAISGYVGGACDGIMMRLVDIGLAIPLVFLFIAMAAILKPDLTLVVGLLVAISWLVPARLVRAQSVSLRTREFVLAARAMGGGSRWLIVRHLIPNSIGIVAVTVTLQIANAILTLAVLQYLGFGLPPSDPTWGSMLAQGINYLQDGYWWEIYPALLLIVLVVLAFNFIGDALQDAFDVRLQSR